MYRQIDGSYPDLANGLRRHDKAVLTLTGNPVHHPTFEDIKRKLKEFLPVNMREFPIVISKRNTRDGADIYQLDIQFGCETNEQALSLLKQESS